MSKVRANRHMWPLQMTSHSAAKQLTTEIFMRRAQKTTGASYLEVDPTQLAYNQGADLDQACYRAPIQSATQACSSTSLPKSLVGLKIPTSGQMNTGSSCNGNVVKHGLLRKLLLSFRAHGSALCQDGLTPVSKSPGREE